MTKPPSVDALADFADAILELANKLDVRHPDLRDVLPLTGTEIAVVRAVHRVPGATPSQIAESTRLQRSNVSTALRSLEARGLIAREPAPENARSVTIRLTAQAADDVARINEYWAGRLRQADPDDLAALIAARGALQRVSAAITRA